MSKSGIESKSMGIKGGNKVFNRSGSQAPSIAEKGKTGEKEACMKLTSSKG